MGSTSDIQNLTDELSEAKDGITKMKEIEAHETKEMQTAATALSDVPDHFAAASDMHKVESVAETVKSLSYKAGSEEDEQQTNALASMNKVDTAIADLESASPGVEKSLGEGEGETPVEHAYNKL